MAGLRDLLESVDCADVRTYIQSGNAVFASTSRSKTSVAIRVLDAVENEFGFRPKLLLLTAAELTAALSSNPFPKAVAAPKTLHYFFLAAKPPAPALGAIDVLAIQTESHRLIGRVFYLHAPDGFGRSKLAAGAERALGVDATARNHATVAKLLDMLADD